MDTGSTTYPPHVDKHGHLADHLPTTSCPRGYWMPPNLKYKFFTLNTNFNQPLLVTFCDTTEEIEASFQTDRTTELWMVTRMWRLKWLFRWYVVCHGSLAWVCIEKKALKTVSHSKEARSIQLQSIYVCIHIEAPNSPALFYPLLASSSSLDWALKWNLHYLSLQSWYSRNI